MNAYLVSHNGLGDNLYMIGALNFIKQFYKNVYFLCKKKYYGNVVEFFDISSNIICVPFDENNEFHEIKTILADKYTCNNTDVFVCGGCHTCYLKSKITNAQFLNHTIINKNYTIDYDTLTSNNYSFIEDFYKDIGLNLTYFYEYFTVPSTNISKTLVDSVSNYYIVFIQYKTSDGKTLDISNLINKYMNDDKVLLLCNDKNLYSEDNEKYGLAQQFVMAGVINYIDIIKNSDEIYLIDSSFVGIVLPLLKTNQLKTNNVRIILRCKTHNYKL